MPEINQLTAVQTISGADQFPVFSSGSGDARKASASVLADFFQEQVSASTGFITQYYAPNASGFSVAISTNTKGRNVHLLLTPTAAFASATIALPSVNDAENGQLVIVTSTNAISSVAFTSTGAQVIGAPAFLDQNTSAIFKYDSVLSTWIAIAFSGNIQSFLQIGSGAVVRSQQNKERDIVSVRDFIITAIDGVTDNQVGIANAVAVALAANALLYWPAGTYVSSASIANFHGVEHFGNGVVKRGSDTFKISGRTGTNIIYVATTGNAGNDGLSAAQPMLTVQNAFDALPNWATQLIKNGTFKVQLAAGIYNAASSLVGLQSKNRLIIAGPNVGGHPNAPTALIDGTAISVAVGMYLQANIYVSIQDIKYQNWTFGSTAYGLVVDGHCDVVATNVHALNCGYAGMSFDNITEVRMLGGVIDACPSYGVRCYSQVSASIGYSGTVAGDSTIIKNCNTAVYGANSCRVHVDYCDINNNATGLLVEKNSRAVANFTKFTTNTIAVQWQLESAYGESGATNVFTTNGKDYVCYGSTDEINTVQNYWDRTTQRTLYGATAYRSLVSKYEWQLDSTTPGASYNSNVKAIFGGNSAINYIGLSGPTNGTVGFIWSTVAKPAQGVLTYNLADDTLRLTINTVDTYRFKSTSIIPVADNTKTMGEAAFRWSDTFSRNFRPGAGTATWTSGTGTPEGAVTAVVGSLFTRTDGGAVTTLYVKETGAGNTGWVAK